MSVILNEAAITALLESPEGPVARFVEDIARDITEAAQANVRDYFHGAPSVTVDQDVGFEMEGSSAVIGIRPEGTKAARLAQSQSEGRVNWLLQALAAARR